MRIDQRIIGVALGAFCGSLWTPATAAETAGGTLSNQIAKPKIKFDQTVYDFGKTSQVETVSGSFKFQNIGDAPLKLGKPHTQA